MQSKTSKTEPSTHKTQNLTHEPPTKSEQHFVDQKNVIQTNPPLKSENADKNQLEDPLVSPQHSVLTIPKPQWTPNREKCSSNSPELRIQTRKKSSETKNQNTIEKPSLPAPLPPSIVLRKPVLVEQPFLFRPESLFNLFFRSLAPKIKHWK